MGLAGSTALLTDHYELTMLQAALASGSADRRCTFEVRTRRLPPGRRYGVLAGVGRLVEAIERFRFGTAELDALGRARVVSEPTLDWLADYRFSGDVDSFAEGEVFLAGEPVAAVTGSFAECVLLETVVLSVLNFDSAVASAGARMVIAAGDRPCLEMGGRRTHEEAAVAAARAAAVVGFTATSNLEAGRRYGLPTTGTSAHAFSLLYDDERAAFSAQVAELGRGTTLLVDTFHVRDAVRTAVDVAGPGLGAVRLDSGDLAQVAVAVREQLDALGATGTRIVVTSDLDEHAIAALSAAPVDAYGVGTSLVTGSGAPTVGFVYKLVERDGVGVGKLSPGKAVPAGRWCVARRSEDGVAAADVLHPGATPPDGESGRALLAPLLRGGSAMTGGAATAGSWLEAARARCRASLAELPPAALRLSDGDPALPVSFADHRVGPGPG